ncbi:unnamed protein product [Fraxinus pennsylvanica]|uniref:Golgi SNAP receptor complex member 1 n=1 Tax=Fraxinus pennsylvanica TaxID=56036 RepID=A0AAD1ZHQ9_9LAMI|nr:unnamed protein product [Fraxinus pennsylvanica]
MSGNSGMDMLQESGWEELRKEARKIEGDLDFKLSSYAKLGARFSQGGYVDAGSPTAGSSRSWKSMEMEIQSLLEKLVDVNDAMSRCAASVAPTTSVTQKLARHRDILHEFTQIDDVIGQAQATRAVLGSQRALFGDVQGKVKLLGDKFPVIRGLIGSIRRKRSRDTLILSAVIAACTLFLIIYWLSK